MCIGVILHILIRKLLYSRFASDINIVNTLTIIHVLGSALKSKENRIAFYLWACLGKEPINTIVDTFY